LMELTAPAAGEVRSSDRPFNGVKVFSTTIVADRERLGDDVVAWLHTRPEIKVTQIFVTQSSDAAFRCIAVTIFYWEPLATGERLDAAL